MQSAAAHGSASRSWIEKQLNHKRQRDPEALVIGLSLDPCRRPEAAGHAQLSPPAVLCTSAPSAIGLP